MKRLLIIPAALALANCAAIPTAISTIGGLSQAVSVNQDKVLIPATQALIVAHNAYQGAAAAATGAINLCTKTPQLAPCVSLLRKIDQIGALSDRAKALLDEADRGHNVAANAAEVMNIVTSMKSLAGV